MRLYRSADGEQRLWFDDDEIELATEDELKKAGLYPTEDKPVVDLDRFIERHLGAKLDPYSELPSNVLGVTEFPRRKPPRVLINKDLTGSALDDENLSQLGRWRATLAHEGAHIMLHRSLFELSDLDQPLFTDETAKGLPNDKLKPCLKRDVAFVSRSHDWREIQANKGMAALLMPRKFFLRMAEEVAEKEGVRYGADSDDALAVPLIRKLSVMFEISRQATSIRLISLGILSPPGYQSLTLT